MAKSLIFFVFLVRDQEVGMTYTGPFKHTRLITCAGSLVIGAARSKIALSLAASRVLGFRVSGARPCPRYLLGKNRPP